MRGAETSPDTPGQLHPLRIPQPALESARPTTVRMVLGEPGVGGDRTASAGRVVHHVVVEQREGVHQLERAAGVDHPAALAARASRLCRAAILDHRRQVDDLSFLGRIDT